MDDAPPPPAEELVLALIVHLLRQGVIDEGGMTEIAASLSDEAKHLANCAIVEAAAPAASAWRAEKARGRLRVIEGGEG